jgi:hypothetical protein
MKTKQNKVTSKRMRVHALFECCDCGRRWEWFMTARELAYKHAKNTGHKVSGEIGTSYHYNF